MKIEIVRTGDVVEVIQDGRTTGQLCMGECIEQVIGLMYPGINKTYPMLTPEEWEARRAYRSEEPAP